MRWQVEHEQTRQYLEHYTALLGLPTERLRVTTDRGEFARWLGRHVRTSIGGAYAFMPRTGEHLVLIHLARIDLSLPKSLEVVVAEELIHMRDRLDGDLRRHAKHGYDRIAHRVAAITGASIEEVRAAVIAPKRRPARFVYACPACGMQVPRRTTGTWSCARCSPRFDRRFLLEQINGQGESAEQRGAAGRDLG